LAICSSHSLQPNLNPNPNPAHPADFVSSVLSTGVSNILALWDLKIDYNDAQKTPDQPRSHWYSYTNADLKAELAAEFKSALASAGAYSTSK
jgi:hypothetical protein